MKEKLVKEKIKCL